MEAWEAHWTHWGNGGGRYHCWGINAGGSLLREHCWGITDLEAWEGHWTHGQRRREYRGITARGITDTVPVMGATKTYKLCDNKFAIIFLAGCMQRVGGFSWNTPWFLDLLSDCLRHFVSRCLSKLMVDVFAKMLAFSCCLPNAWQICWPNRLFLLVNCVAESILFFCQNYWLNRFLVLAELLAECLTLVEVVLECARWVEVVEGETARKSSICIYGDLLFV